MADLVRNDLEIEAKPVELALIVAARAHLDKSTAGLRVVPVNERNELERRIAGCVPPDYASAEKGLPNIQNTSHAGIGVRRQEGPVVHRNLIEMAIGCRQGGRSNSTVVGRH